MFPHPPKNQSNDTYVQIERQIVAGSQQGAAHHRVHADLHRRRRPNAENAQLQQHRHQNGEAPQRGEHRQAERLRAAQPEHHVPQIDQRQRKDLAPGVAIHVREADDAQLLAEAEHQNAGGHLADAQHQERRELVGGEHRLVDDGDEERGEAVEHGAGHLLVDGRGGGRSGRGHWRAGVSTTDR